MRVSPIDVANKTFGRKLYGLDTEEVYDFLRNVADEMEAMSRTQEQLEEKLAENAKMMADFKEREETLKQTLQTAAQMSEKMRVESHRESELIIKESRQRGDIIIKEARESLRSMYQDINDLKKSRMQFEAGLKSLVKAHLAMLDQGHSVVPDPQITVDAPAGVKPIETPEPQVNA